MQCQDMPEHPSSSFTLRSSFPHAWWAPTWQGDPSQKEQITKNHPAGRGVFPKKKKIHSERKQLCSLPPLWSPPLCNVRGQGVIKWRQLRKKKKQQKKPPRSFSFSTTGYRKIWHVCTRPLQAISISLRRIFITNSWGLICTLFLSLSF